MVVRILQLLLLGVVAAAGSTVNSAFSNVCVSDTNLTVDDAKVAHVVRTIIGYRSNYLAVSNVRFIGHCTCAGAAELKDQHTLAPYFTKNVSIFSTGSASQAVVEENTSDGFTGWIDSDVTESTDEHILASVRTTWDQPEEPTIYDACGIQMTVTVLDTVIGTKYLAFTYVYASEEYNMYVDSGKYDHMGVYIDGVNKALVHDSADRDHYMDPVNVDSINESTNGDMYVWNPARNRTAPDGPLQPDNYAMEYDGFTVPLGSVPYSIQAGDVFNLKVAIADVGDNRLDSAVFLQGGLSVTSCISNATHVCGDPHILSFDGARFMFNGWENGFFNMLSHPSYQINTQFKKFEHPNKLWIGSVGMKIADDARIEVTSAGKGKLIVKVNDQAIDLKTSIKEKTYSVEYVGRMDGDKAVRISTPDMVVSVGVDYGSNHLQFSVDQISLGMGTVHGVVGQSYKRMVQQKTAMEQGKKPSRPVSGVQGVDKDYAASGLFADDFTFNQFDATPITHGSVRLTSTAGSTF